jgi:hypothetical protein
MTRLGKAAGIFVSSTLLLTSAAFAAANSDKASRKGNHPAQKTAPVAVRHVVKPQATIVMGRSVSVHHKTKLHHVKVNPVEADDAQGDSQL